MVSQSKKGQTGLTRETMSLTGDLVNKGTGRPDYYLSFELICHYFIILLQCHETVSDVSDL